MEVMMLRVGNKLDKIGKVGDIGDECLEMDKGVLNARLDLSHEEVDPGSSVLGG